MYFKGRTLGSFVRQLNMYNFHKVKGQKHRHVFRHPFFKRGDEESLKNIRRKHVGKELRLRSTQSNEKEMHPWNQLMADKLCKLREVLDIMGKQNQDLVCINNRMVNELQHLKQGWQSKSKDLISLASNVINNPNSKLVGGLKTFMAELGLDASLCPLLTSADVLEFFNRVQGDQFKNEMNIFVVTEQLTSLYKQRNNKSPSNDLNKLNVTKVNKPSVYGSCNGGSTNNNTSSFTEEDSNQFGCERYCNSVDDISHFDVSEKQFGASEHHFDAMYRTRVENSEFESFMLDAFDSLSADEGYLFTERGY